MGSLPWGPVVHCGTLSTVDKSIERNRMLAGEVFFPGNHTRARWVSFSLIFKED